MKAEPALFFKPNSHYTAATATAITSTISLASYMASQDSQPFPWHYAELDENDFQVRGRALFYVLIVSSMTILITLLSIYARWVCLENTRHNLSSRRPVPHAPSLPLRGLDSATIKALPIALHKSNLGTGNNGTAVESECCICLGVFEDGDRLKVLPQCQHCFHCECVDNWLVTQSSCPLCRASVRADSAVLSIITE